MENEGRASKFKMLKDRVERFVFETVCVDQYDRPLRNQKPAHFGLAS